MGSRRNRSRWFVAALFVTAAACTPAPVAMLPDLGPPDLIDCVANPMSCGQCATDNDCKGSPSLPRCDTRKHVCIECLPASDNCAMGKVCSPYADGYACSVSCLLNADCTKLGGGIACCTGSCRDPKTDVMNCGGCGLACVGVPNSTPACAAGKCTLACTGSFKDCDGFYETGCEIDTTADNINCGGCGVVCPAQINGTGLCKAGACGLSCKPGFADCNKQAADGCEVDLTFDTANCGACGTKAPPAANATAFCDNGKASFRCKGHFFDCDGNAANGCELDSTSDANNCGHCGNVCPTYANSTSACATATCSVACNANYGDCNKNVMDGCETPLATDTNNCGGCGKGCKSINGTAVCAAGSCTLTCLANFADCNKDANDGCEVNLNYFDGKNCGACGTVCPMGKPFCYAGSCVNINTNVAVLGAEYSQGYMNDVQAKLTALNVFSNVDLINVQNSTPSLATLKTYGAVIVWSDAGYADPTTLGNNLADYFDGGGQVVPMFWSNYQGAAIGGRYGAPGNGYILLQPSYSYYSNYNDGLGTIIDKQSPLILGVGTFNATYGYCGGGSLINGGFSVANWSSSGRPLVVRGTKTINGVVRNLVQLNFDPVSASQVYYGWTGDGAILMRNALLYQ